MANIQLKVFNDMIQKLSMPKNDRLASKALEIQELIKAKSSEVLKHINDNARVILCIHISSELLLNAPIETSTHELIKLSSLSKAQYNKHRKVFLKILDLNKKVTIDEVIRKLGISQAQAATVEKSAKEIFKFYIEQQSFETEAQDISASVYAMSVYFACKAESIKVAKKNVLTLSTLTQGQWTLMEKSWEKWAPSVPKKCSGNKENRKTMGERIEGQTVTTTAVTAKTKQAEESEESYEAWAQRILDQARKELNT